MTLKYLIRKEFLQIRRNAFLPRLIVLFPIVIMCIAPWITSLEVRNVVVAVVDHDRSTLSQQLVRRIEASNYFVFGGQKASYEEAIGEVERMEADIIVEIPRNYGRDCTNGRTPQVLIAANAVNGTKGSMGATYLGSIVAQHITPDGVEALNEQISTLLLYNKHQDYKLFMIPSLTAILLMMMCGFLPALNIVGEKESGTIEAINVTPVSRWSFILAKLIPYWLIGLLVLTVCFLLAWGVYGITSAGSLWLVYLLAVLFALLFSGFGLVISNYNETMQQAVLVMWFFVVCLMLLSGLFTPVRSMPRWAYLTTYVNPMHYFIDAIRTVFVRGGDFTSIAPQVGVLAAIALFLDGWAIWSYRKNK